MAQNATPDDAQNANADNELSEQSAGSLRVARRRFLRAGQEAENAYQRIDLDAHGDFTRDGVANRGRGAVASAFQTADMIENELDQRDEDYRPRNDVLDAVQ